MQCNKGDVLIVKRPGCRCPECRDNNETYIIVYDHAYRPHSAYEVYNADPWGRADLDREWPIFEFYDEEIVDKLEKATEEHNRFVEILSKAIKKMQRDMSIELVGISIADKEFHLLRDRIYSIWLGPFLQNAYQEYVELFTISRD